MDQETQQRSSWHAAHDAELTTYDVWLQYFSIGGNIKFWLLQAGAGGFGKDDGWCRGLLSRMQSRAVDF